jgi:hypothetical protein
LIEQEMSLLEDDVNVGVCEDEPEFTRFTFSNEIR